MTNYIDEFIYRSRKVQEKIEFWTQEQVYMMVSTVGWETYKQENAESVIPTEDEMFGTYWEKFGK